MIGSRPTMAFNSRGRRSGSLIRETAQLRPTHVPGGTGCALHQRRKPCALSTSSSITHAPAGSLLGTAPEHLLHGNERREALTISGEEGKREGRDMGEGGLTLVIEKQFRTIIPTYVRLVHSTQRRLITRSSFAAASLAFHTTPVQRSRALLRANRASQRVGRNQRRRRVNRTW